MTSGWPPRAAYPNTCGSSPSSMPGVSLGTTTIDCCKWRDALGLVLPMTMKTLQRSARAPELNHLRPLSTYSSPSRSIESEMLVASDDEESSSVMQKALRISPANRGSSHWDLMASEP